MAKLVDFDSITTHELQKHGRFKVETYRTGDNRLDLAVVGNDVLVCIGGPVRAKETSILFARREFMSLVKFGKNNLPETQ